MWSRTQVTSQVTLKCEHEIEGKTQIKGGNSQESRVGS